MLVLVSPTLLFTPLTSLFFLDRDFLVSDTFGSVTLVPSFSLILKLKYIYHDFIYYLLGYVNKTHIQCKQDAHTIETKTIRLRQLKLFSIPDIQQGNSDLVSIDAYEFGKILFDTIVFICIILIVNNNGCIII